MGLRIVYGLAAIGWVNISIKFFSHHISAVDYIVAGVTFVLIGLVCARRCAWPAKN